MFEMDSDIQTLAVSVYITKYSVEDSSGDKDGQSDTLMQSDIKKPRTVAVYDIANNNGAKVYEPLKYAFLRMSCRKLCYLFIMDQG